MNDIPPNDSNNVEPTPPLPSLQEINNDASAAPVSSPPSVETTPTAVPPPTANATPPAPGDSSEPSKDKIIAGIISFLITSVLFGLVGLYYNSLMKYEDIKYVRDEIECIDKTEGCRISKQRFTFYRFGETSIKDVSLNILMKEGFKINPAASSIKRYEKGLFSGTDSQYSGASKISSPVPDPLLPEDKSCRYKVKELSPASIYEIILEVEREDKDKTNEAIAIVDIFQGDDPLTFSKGLSFQDYLRLYALEITLLTVVAAIVIFISLWIFIVFIYKKKKGERLA